MKRGRDRGQHASTLPRPGTSSRFAVRASGALLLLLLAGPIHAETWMGLEVRAGESLLHSTTVTVIIGTPSPWNRAIAKRMGGIRCRYTGHAIPEAFGTLTSSTSSQ